MIKTFDCENSSETLLKTLLKAIEPVKLAVENLSR